MSKDLAEKLEQLKTLRETKGKEKESLALIDELLPLVEEQEDWEKLVDLHWNSHLVWQHYVMSEVAKSEEERDADLMADGVANMRVFAEKAMEVIEEHELNDMKGVGFRFLGRAATYAEDHIKAKEYYEMAIENFSGSSAKSKLEVSGFLAEALILLGESQEGLNLAKKTYTEFLNSDLGQNLKKEDYFTWAVWMSGIAPRICNALIKTGADFNKEEMSAWLETTKTELENPSGDATWGDGGFQFRMDELKSIIAKLQVALLVFIPFIR